MKAYKFHITTEDKEFRLEISMLEDDTFLDFNDFLIDACNLQGNKLASFYPCDNNWNKQMEISLLDMSDEKKPDTDFDDDGEIISALPLKTMESTTLKEIISESNKKLIYEYNFYSPLTLFIECIAIKAEKDIDDFSKTNYIEGELYYDEIEDEFSNTEDYYDDMREDKINFDDNEEEDYNDDDDDMIYEEYDDEFD